jgi:hypothetical protein
MSDCYWWEKASPHLLASRKLPPIHWPAESSHPFTGQQKAPSQSLASRKLHLIHWQQKAPSHSLASRKLPLVHCQQKAPSHSLASRKLPLIHWPAESSLSFTGQQKASSHSWAIASDTHDEHREMRAKVRPNCSIFEQLEPWSDIQFNLGSSWACYVSHFKIHTLSIKWNILEGNPSIYLASYMLTQWGEGGRGDCGEAGRLPFFPSRIFQLYSLMTAPWLRAIQGISCHPLPQTRLLLANTGSIRLTR